MADTLRFYMFLAARYADMDLGHLLALCHYRSLDVHVAVKHRIAGYKCEWEEYDKLTPRSRVVLRVPLGHSRNARFSQPEVHLSASLIFLVVQQTFTHLKRIKQKLQTSVRPLFYQLFRTLNSF